MGSIRVVAAPVLAVLLLATVAAGCSSSDGDDIESAAFDSVLMELFGTTDTDAYLAEAQRGAADLVVACMTEAGFDFEAPADPSPEPTPDPSDVDAARSDGFGIISGFLDQVAATELSAAADPNLLYLSTLTAAEIERFFVTLDGPEAEPGQRREGGCNGQASTVAYADWVLFTETLPNYTTLGEERDTHPDWLTARAAWQQCMADRGFDYAEPEAIRTDVIARMRATVADVYPGGQVPLVEVDGVVTVAPQVDDLLADLVAFERAAAVANAECTKPLAERFAAVEQEVQKAFVDRHQQAIDGLLEAVTSPR